jgi:L-ribulose-5-phosphate 3-epimerase
MSNWKIGCAIWTLGATPDVATLRQHMEMVGEIGCTSVQPWAVDVEYTPCILDPDLATPAIRREVAMLPEQTGVGFSGFCAQLQGRETYGGLEEEEGLEERIAKTQAVLTLAVELGAPIVSTHVGKMAADPAAPAYQTLLRSVAAIARHAEEVGAIFAPETGQESPEELKAFIERIGSPALKVNYDPCNLLRFGSEEGTVRGVHLLKDYIVHTHAKDWNPRTRLATCGDGDVPWSKYLTALKEIGYEGVLAIEDESGNDDMIGSIRASHRFLSKC